MGTIFWIRRFFTVLAIAGTVIALAQWMKGQPLRNACIQGAIWGVISATVFTAARIYQSRRKQHCAICKDTPEMARSEQGDA